MSKPTRINLTKEERKAITKAADSIEKYGIIKAWEALPWYYRPLLANIITTMKEVICKENSSSQ